jgi:hypothetical protein
MPEPHLEKLRNNLQEHLLDEDDDLGVLTGYVVIAQWSDGDGDEWFSRTAATINDEPAAVWTVKGWLTHALDSVDAPIFEEEDPE